MVFLLFALPPPPVALSLRWLPPENLFFQSPPSFLSLQPSTTSPTDFVGKVLPRVTIPTFEIYQPLHRPGQVGTYFSRSFSFLKRVRHSDTPTSRPVLRLSDSFVFGQIESDIAGRVHIIKRRAHEGRKGRYTQTLRSYTSVTFPLLERYTVYSIGIYHPTTTRSHSTKGLPIKTLSTLSKNNLSPIPLTNLDTLAIFGIPSLLSCT